LKKVLIIKFEEFAVAFKRKKLIFDDAVTNF